MTECAGIEPEVEEPDEPENSEVEVSEEEPEEEKQMSADIIIDLDKGYFEGWEGAEEL